MSNKNMKIGIIGFGNFGKLAACILARDFTVRVFDNGKAEKYGEAAEKIGVALSGLDDVLDSEIVILCAPISETEKVIKDIAGRLKPGTLLIDTCSVKVLPCRWLKKYAPRNIEILGTHPMFGPTTTRFDIGKKTFKLDDKQIVLCPLRISSDRLGRVRKYLSELGIEVIATTPQDHDRQNAKTLGLVHFIGRSLMAVGAGEQKIYTPGYIDLLKIMPHTTSDNWQLFFDMHNFNPYAEKLADDYLAAGGQLREKTIKARSADDLDFHREMIGRIDRQMFGLFKERFKHVKAVGKIKKKNGLRIVDKKRENELIERRVKESGLDEKFVNDLYKLIFKESYKRQ